MLADRCYCVGIGCIGGTGPGIWTGTAGLSAFRQLETRARTTLDIITLRQWMKGCIM